MAKLNSFWNTIKNKSSRLPLSFLNKNSSSEDVFELKKQRDLDKKLVYSLNKRKIPTFRQLRYLPLVLNKKERRLSLGLLAAAIVSGLFMGGFYYFNNFSAVPAYGGEYTEGLIGAPQYINPLLSQTNDVDSDISKLIFSGLLRYNHDLQLEGDLAQDWTISEDEKVYTFTLKENIQWHDGQPVTIDDVIFTFESIKDPDFKSPLLISFRGVSIEKLYERTVRFILPEAYPSFLEVLTVGIIPQHIWGEIPAINANLTEYNLRPVGSGQWRFVELTKDKLGNIKSYIIEPNPVYHGPKPYIQKITFKFYPDFQTAVAALKNHSIEGISFLPKEFKSDLGASKALNYHSFILPQYTAVFFNQKKNAVLAEKDVRRALALSIDKNKILSEALQLGGDIIDGPILPVVINDLESAIIYNPSQAAKLLDEAGWKQISTQEYIDLLEQKRQAELEAESEEEESSENPTEETETTTEENIEPTSTTTPQIEAVIPTSTQPYYRLNDDDQVLEVTLTTVNQTENVVAAELIKNFWEQIGVKVNLIIVEGSRISREIIKPRNYEILLFGIIVGSNPDPLPFWHSSQVADPGLNLSQFSNRQVDAMLEEAQTLETEEELKAKYTEFLNTLNEEIPSIFLYNPTYTYVVENEVKGINLNRIIVPSDRFNNIYDWYIETKRIYRPQDHL